MSSENHSVDRLLKVELEVNEPEVLPKLAQWFVGHGDARMETSLTKDRALVTLQMWNPPRELESIFAGHVKEELTLNFHEAPAAWTDWGTTSWVGATVQVYFSGNVTQVSMPFYSVAP